MSKSTKKSYFEVRRRTMLVNAYRRQLALVWGDDLPPDRDVSELSHHDKPKVYAAYETCAAGIFRLLTTQVGRDALKLDSRAEQRGRKPDAAAWREEILWKVADAETPVGEVATTKAAHYYYSVPYVNQIITQTFLTLASAECHHPELFEPNTDAQSYDEMTAVRHSVPSIPFSAV